MASAQPTSCSNRYRSRPDIGTYRVFAPLSWLPPPFAWGTSRPERTDRRIGAWAPGVLEAAANARWCSGYQTARRLCLNIRRDGALECLATIPPHPGRPDWRATQSCRDRQTDRSTRECPSARTPCFDARTTREWKAGEVGERQEQATRKSANLSLSRRAIRRDKTMFTEGPPRRQVAQPELHQIRPHRTDCRSRAWSRARHGPGRRP